MANEIKPIEENEENLELAQPVPVEDNNPTRRETFLANLRKKHPDVEDEDELFGKAMEGYDAEHDYAKQQREETGRLADIMKGNDDLAAMYAELFERGPEGNPEMALINIAPLLKSYLSGEISSEEYEAKKAENKKAEEEKNSKMAAQEQVFKEVCEEEGLDYEETLGKIAEKLLNPMAAYEIGKEQVKALINMVNYDDDVEAARVQGRNETIEARKRKMERQSDGLPSGGSAAQPSTRAEETQLQRIASRRAAAKNL